MAVTERDYFRVKELAARGLSDYATAALIGQRLSAGATASSRQSNHRNLSVSHRHSVAILERIVGPKT